MIVTRGYGSNLLIAKGYGSVGVSESIKREVIRIYSYICSEVSLVQYIPSPRITLSQSFSRTMNFLSKFGLEE